MIHAVIRPRSDQSENAGNALDGRLTCYTFLPVQGRSAGLDEISSLRLWLVDRSVANDLPCTAVRIR